MSTYNFTDGSISGVKKPHNTTPRGFETFMLRNIIDFTKQNCGSTDVVKALSIPAGVIVLGVVVNALTAEGATCTVDIGITGTDADRWGNDISINATGVVNYQEAFVYPTYFSSADTIDLLVNSASTDAAKLELIAVCVDSNSTIDAGANE